MKTKSSILVIDDNKEFCDSIKVCLADAGYIVACVYNGKDAISLSKSNSYDIVLVDIKLPDIPGIELVNKLEKISPTTEFIYVTAHASFDSAIKAIRQERVISYETKPLDVKHLLSTLKQVFRRRKAEMQVRKLSHAIENSPSMIVITDCKGNIEYVNSKFTQVTGYTRKQVIGKNPRILKSNKTQPEVYEDLWNTIMVGHEWHGELYNRKKNGNLFVESLSISPVRNVANAITHFIAIKEDITERKKIEKELLKVQKLESLGIIAGGIAHDFNNYLAAILGNISLAKMSLIRDNKPYENVREIEKITLLAKKLTQQLITFSKGGIPIKKSSSIRNIIDESTGFSLRGSNVRCQISIPDDIWTVEIDEGQIGQVISNLIINAVQAMPEGGTIKVWAENVSVKEEEIPTLKTGNYVKIIIQDQGIGIPKEEIQNIFDPFFTTKKSGSGLGLAVCYSIIKNHNGYICVQSEEGIETRFNIFIPATQKKVESVKIKHNEPVSGKGKILIMDDDHHIRYTTRKLLKNFGYDVDIAKDGNEAINSYHKALESGNPFDAVILDLTIPGGMGGKSAIKKLLETDPRVKAIVTSGYSNDPVMSNFREYGFCGVITKPFEIQELNETLRNAIQG